MAVRAKIDDHGPSYSSGTEAAYAAHLHLLERAGEIRSWTYEPVKIRIAHSCYYTPDFMIHMPDDTIEFHETKGFMREAARIRLRTAAEKLPMFRFVLVKREKGNWTFEEVKT